MPTYITPVIGSQIVVALGDGATPTEIFAANACINTTRGISYSAETESDELIDTTDQSAPAKTVRRVRSIDTKIDGAGMVSKADLKYWIDWLKSGAAKNIKISFPTGGPLHTGSYVCTSLQVTADRLKTAEFSVTLEQADGPTITVAP